MTPKPVSVNLGASNKDASTPGDSDSDAADGMEMPKPTGESYDDSLEAILLQAGARPPEPATSKLLNSKTLMGLGIEGLNLAGLRAAEAATEDGEAAIPAADLSDAGGAKSGANSSAKSAEGKATTDAIPSEDKAVTSLLDEVAQALNVQASEYRDRARGRLPGMPSPTPVAGKGAGQALTAPGRNQAEFEDPDDSPAALTPGVIPVLQVHDESEPEVSLEADELAADEDEDEALVLAPSELAGAGRPKPNSRPVAVPPVPGLSLGAAPPPVGPPPGLPPRTATPAVGQATPGSGRVRLPTPMPGLPLPMLPAPVAGRLTLPPGIASPLGLAAADLTATAPSTPIALESSRRVSGARSGAPGPGRVSARRTARVTEQVRPLVSPLPTVLTAHVKLATLSLAGLIAVTFAGGLFVGMLVWKGQGRSEPAPAARIAATAGTVVPSPTLASPENVKPVPAAGGTTPPTTIGGAAVMIPAPGAPSTEPVVTPIATGSASPESPPAVPKPARRLAAAQRPRRPPTIPTVADTVALFPKAAPGKAAPRPVVGTTTGAASKTMANNAGGKPVAKSKTKSTWHDPFAD